MGLIFVEFPISRDPPEGGTSLPKEDSYVHHLRFQFLGIPPKGELCSSRAEVGWQDKFPISRDPPEGGTTDCIRINGTQYQVFPISRDPPEGGTWPVVKC